MKFIETYEEIKEIEKYTLRQKLRDAVIEPLSFFYNRLNPADKLLATPRIQFLYIHHVFRDEEKALEKLIAELSRTHCFISHSEAVNRILSGDIDKPYIAISSDDGLKNNVNAAAILDRFNIKACFFVCPAIIEEKDYDKIALFSKERLHLPPVEFMTWRDIERLMMKGHEIGGHTMNHVNLAGLHLPEASQEIGLCYEKINAKCGNVQHFAYPYGRFFHFNDELGKKVFQAGFRSCASAERGCHIPNTGSVKPAKDSLLIRRDHILLNWSLDQIHFFILRNIQNAHYSKNFFPYNGNNNNHE